MDPAIYRKYIIMTNIFAIFSVCVFSALFFQVEIAEYSSQGPMEFIPSKGILIIVFF